MSKLGINTGSSANAGDGDSLLSGAIKINSNFNELYTALGDGSTLSNPVTSIVAGTNVSVSSSTGDVTINATASGGGGGVDIQDEGVALATTATTLNFVGNGVVASGTGTTKTITISGGGSGGAGIDVQDEGVALATTATTLNFVGGGVVASGTGATKTITISGGGGSGGTWTTYDSNTGVTTTKKVKIENDLEVTGVVTARSGLRVVGGGLTVSGVTTFFNAVNVNNDMTFDGTGNNLRLNDNSVLEFGTGNDLNIYHNSNVSVISDSGAGGLQIDSDNEIKLAKNGTGNDSMAVFTVDGSAELYYDGAKKFETTAGGVSITGTSTFTGDVSLGSSISLVDNKAIMLGAGHDLQILHTGSHSVIKDVGTGNLNINASRLLISNPDGSEYLGKFDADGGVELYYDNNKKLDTGSGGVNVTGDLTVTGEVTGGRIKVVGIVTADSAVIGAGSSTDGVETPMMTLTHNNPTVVGTSGTTGQFKQIGGAPFFYDGAVWREFVLSTGTPVTRREDSDWDSVILRLDFEDDTTIIDQIENIKVLGAGLDQSPDTSSSNEVDLVGSPAKYGTKALRFSGGNDNFPFAWTNRITNTNDKLFDFTGGWTIEMWLYLPSLSSTTLMPIISETVIDSDPDNDWSLLLQFSQGSTYVFRWYNVNNGDSYNDASPGTIISAIDSTALLNQWNHIALVRDPLDSSMHFFINGVESGHTNGSIGTVTDTNLAWGGTSSYLSFGYHYKLAGSNDHYTNMVIDDVRISTTARYTSNFTAPTAALPVAGTASTVYTPPGSKQGEIALGTSPTWTGMSGVTASRIDAGHYRATFSSSFGSSSDYVITTSMNDHIPSTTAVGIGVTRYTAHADFIVTRVSDSVGIDSGSLAINLMKK